MCVHTHHNENKEKNNKNGTIRIETEKNSDIMHWRIYQNGVSVTTTPLWDLFLHFSIIKTEKKQDYYALNQL
jgi:hypothetical protein